MVFSRIEAQIEAQGVEIGPEEKAIALAYARQEFEQGFWPKPKPGCRSMPDISG